MPKRKCRFSTSITTWILAYWNKVTKALFTLLGSWRLLCNKRRRKDGPHSCCLLKWKLLRQYRKHTHTHTHTHTLNQEESLWLSFSHYRFEHVCSAAPMKKMFCIGNRARLIYWLVDSEFFLELKWDWSVMRDVKLNKLGFTYLTHLVRKESTKRCIEPALLSFLCILFGFEYFGKSPHLHIWPTSSRFFLLSSLIPHSPLSSIIVSFFSSPSILFWSSTFSFLASKCSLPTPLFFFFLPLSFFPSLTWHLAGQPASHQDKRYDLTSLQCSKDMEGDSKGKNKITWGGMLEN